MGAFPRTTTPRVRPIHLRGIERCIMKMGMTDFDEIARACALLNASQVEDSLTQLQKMKLGKLKKKKEKPSEPDE